MVFKISNTYRDENEAYITVPVLKKFLKSKDIKIRGSREDLLLTLEEYASQSEETMEEVQNWLDATLKEGIKEIWIKKVFLDEKEKYFLFSGKFKQKLDDLIVDRFNHHLSNITYKSELQLFRYDILNSANGRVVSLCLGKLVYIKYGSEFGKISQYPIFVDMYIDLDIIVARGKNRTGMYQYKDKNFSLEEAVSTNVAKELKNAINISLEIMQIKNRGDQETARELKEKLYYMLEEYAETPQEIVAKMDEKREEIQTTATFLLENICQLGEEYSKDILFDIENIVEKYLSISYPDKDIFTLNRNAYPLRIIAKDAEESQVDETAAAQEPLQSKEIFFDNKKMLQKNKACDGIVFMFMRKDSTYFRKEFQIKIVIVGEYCTLKFVEYTMEDDINNVLFSLINATEISSTRQN